MTRDEFWKLIDRSRRGTEDTEEQMENLYERLQKLEVQDLIDFDHHFHKCLSDAYRQDIWAVAYIINGGCSDDGFDYFLGWLIAQGKKYFEATLADPEHAGKRAEPGEEVECEEIWYVAIRAYEAKTGKTDFYDQCKNVPRKLKGKSWDEDTVHELYLKLSKKFSD